MTRTYKNFLLILLIILSLISMVLTVGVSKKAMENFNSEIVGIYDYDDDYNELYKKDYIDNKYPNINYDSLSNHHSEFDEDFDKWFDEWFNDSYSIEDYHDDYYNPPLEENIEDYINSGDMTLVSDAIIIMTCFALFFIESSVLVLSFLYLILSDYNKYTSKHVFKKLKNILLFVISSIIFIPTFTIILIILSIVLSNSSLDEFDYPSYRMEDGYINEYNNSSKDKIEVTSKDINLNKYNKDIVIKKDGEYNVTGKFKNSIIIDTDNKEVTLKLNNINIDSKNSSIVALSGSKLKIELVNNTINKLNDSEKSKYESCIYSKIPLTIEGSGSLEINSNKYGLLIQSADLKINNGLINIISNKDGIKETGMLNEIIINDGIINIDSKENGINASGTMLINNGTLFISGDEDKSAGITTESGYKINGGTVVSMGVNIIESPYNSSSQNTVILNFNELIDKDNIMAITKDTNEEILTFKSKKKFNTIVISSSKLENGNYKIFKDCTHSGKEEYGLYKDGELNIGNNIPIENNEYFVIDSTITLHKNI